MDKYLTYSVVERKDPQNPEVPGKFYAQAQARGEAGIRELSQRIQQSCTVTRADVMAVLIALEDVVSDSLANGEIVRLGELGSLQVSLKGKGSDTAEEYHDGLIEDRERQNHLPWRRDTGQHAQHPEVPEGGTEVQEGRGRTSALN